jgi:hypothetical protein
MVYSGAQFTMPPFFVFLLNQQKTLLRFIYSIMFIIVLRYSFSTPVTILYISKKGCIGMFFTSIALSSALIPQWFTILFISEKQVHRGFCRTTYFNFASGLPCTSPPSSIPLHCFWLVQIWRFMTG